MRRVGVNDEMRRLGEMRSLAVSEMRVSRDPTPTKP